MELGSFAGDLLRLCDGVVEAVEVLLERAKSELVQVPTQRIITPQVAAIVLNIE